MRKTQVLALAAFGPLLWGLQDAVEESPATPSPEEQAKLVNQVRQYALEYTDRLPDFICLEQIRRSVADAGRQAWRPMDVLTARLSYFNQKESHKLISRNGRMLTDASYEAAGGPSSAGDFGTFMRDIFDPASGTRFAWKRWTMLRGHLTQVFAYRVPARLYTLDYQGEQGEHAQTTKVAYRGLVFVDKKSPMIVRITHEALNISPSFPVKEASETLDYDFTQIGDKEFFLPLVATLQTRIQMYNGAVWMMNVKEFRMYRKFSSDAVIKFDGQELAPLPLTTEQPIQKQAPK